MSVPTYDQFIEPVLRHLAGRPEGAPARDVHDAAAEALHPSDADRMLLVSRATLGHTTAAQFQSGQLELKFEGPDGEFKLTSPK